MEASYEQIVLLPNPRHVIDDANEFYSVRNRVRALTREAERRDLNAPSLRRQLEMSRRRKLVQQYYGCRAGSR